MSSSGTHTPPSSGHAFEHPRGSDSRAPCPALNALANHGYLPRDGRSIGHRTLVQALRDVFNFSLPLALFLSFIAILLCGNGFQLDLCDLSVHGDLKIEHDGSLVHNDTRAGARSAPIFVNRTLLRRLLGRAAPGHGLTLADFAKARASRDGALAAALDRVHAEVARGESALTWLIMRDKQDEVSTTALSQFYGDERIPDRWTRPSKSIGLREVRGCTSHVADLVRQLKHTETVENMHSTFHFGG